jgi:hypothetical protein
MEETPNVKRSRTGLMILNGFTVPDSCETETLKLQSINPHPRDKFIAFEDLSHKYYIKGTTTGYVSVSGLAHEYFEEFDAPHVASRMISRSNFKTAAKYQKYQGLITPDDLEKSVVDICAFWAKTGQAAARLGTLLHRYIELDYNDALHLWKDEDVTGIEYEYFRVFKRHMQELGYRAYRTEFKLFDEEYKVAGMIDMLFYHPEKNIYSIYDWKRSKEIKHFGFKKGTGPCSKLQDCNYNHYSLQLNSYKWLIERNYDIKIHNMAIVVFHPNNDSYLEFQLPDLQEEVSAILELRKTNIYSNLDQITTPGQEIQKAAGDLKLQTVVQ